MEVLSSVCCLAGVNSKCGVHGKNFFSSQTHRLLILVFVSRMEGSPKDRNSAKHVNMSYAETKTLIKNRFHQNWKQRRHITAEDTSLRELDRWQQTTIFRLRTGHCQILSHLYRLMLSHTNECLCGTGVQDPEHILQNSPIHTLERTHLWTIWG